MNSRVILDKKETKKNKETIDKMLEIEKELKKTYSDIFELASLEQKKRSYEIIKVFSSEQINPKFKIELSIVKWLFNGVLSLEKRKWFYNEKFRYWKMGVRIPFKKKDIETIEQNLHEIKSLLS